MYLIAVKVMFLWDVSWGPHRLSWLLTSGWHRCGVLLCTNATKETTKTMSHILWCLYNLLPPKMVQAPHKHSSIAIDLVISCPKGAAPRSPALCTRPAPARS